MTEAAAQSFPCKNCGAKLTYDAGARAMACPYCGFKEAVAATAAAAAAPAATPQQAADGWTPAAAAPASNVREIPLEEGIRMAARGFGAPVTTVTCKDCGASVHVGQGERTTTCAFCGSKQVLAQEAGEQPIRPESLLPFQVTKEQANKRFGDWLGTLWFRPNDLKKIAKVQEMGGVYVPFWTFDSRVSSQWTAERGWHYYETEYYTTTVNGRTEQHSRQVQRTRWEPASGYRQDFFDDVLVCAGRALPNDLVDKLSTFDTKKLEPYRPEYLAGWRAEAYAIDLQPAFGVAQQKMSRVQEGRCGSDVGGDVHRGLMVQNQFANPTFKHVLLPIWIAAYRYNGKAFRFLVNGQTGEIVGVAPWSVWKIALAILAALVVIGGIIAAIVANQPSHAPPPTPATITTSTPPILTAIPTTPTPTPAPTPTEHRTTPHGSPTAPAPHPTSPHPAPHPSTTPAPHHP